MSVVVCVESPQVAATSIGRPMVAPFARVLTGVTGTVRTSGNSAGARAVEAHYRKAVGARSGRCASRRLGGMRRPVALAAGVENFDSACLLVGQPERLSTADNALEMIFWSGLLFA